MVANVKQRKSLMGRGMKYRKLGNTDIDISLICLGSMTWGEQNTQQQAFEQIDYCLDQGVNIIDTAEIYSVPPNEQNYGATESIIGNWFEKTGRRADVFLASKVTGRAPLGYMRPHLGAETRLSRAHIVEACDASLQRLKTDYIDLYQLHWPDRKVNKFGQLAYEHDDEDTVPLLESLQALGELVAAGKVRYVGLSNETPWGTMKYLQLAKEHNLPRVMSVQNPYNLINRSYDFAMSEVSLHEQVGLFAYSPLAMGILSGKYSGGARPEGARMTIYNQYFSRYIADHVIAVVDKYVAIANKHGLDPVVMAHAFVNRQPFTMSNIIGATKVSQIKPAIESVDMILSSEVLEDINAVFLRHPHPLA